MKRNLILSQLTKLIQFESVSTDEARADNVKLTAKHLQELFMSIGFDVKILNRSQAHPLILAVYQKKENKKTIAIYAHYDVQPEDPVSEWKSPPFKLTSRNGKLLARGIADDKASIIQTYVALSECIKAGTLNCNVILILEGEEEIGSVNFESYINQVKKQLSSVDAFYILDSGLFKKNVPCIFYGLRGLVSFELTIKTAKRDLHSGSYGNKVLNPAHIIASIASKLKNPEDNRVLIPNFYDEVRKIPKDEKNLLAKVDRSIEEEIKESSAMSIVSIDGISQSLVSKIYPSLDINGMYSGYLGQGVKTIIPSTATIKFTCRLVENQDSNIIQKRVLKYIKSIIPKGVEFTLISNEAIDPFYCELDNEYIKHTAQIFSNVFGNETLYNRSGGSIPAAEILQRIFGKPVIVTGFSMPDSNLHSPNENIDEVMFFRGIEALTKLFSEV